MRARLLLTAVAASATAPTAGSSGEVLAWFSPAGIPRADCERYALKLAAAGAITGVAFEDAYGLSRNGSLTVDHSAVEVNQLWRNASLKAVPIIPLVRPRACPPLPLPAAAAAAACCCCLLPAAALLL